MTDIQPETNDNYWLALMIGNSRLHWAVFNGQNLHSSWDTAHLPESTIQELAKSQTLNELLIQIVSNSADLPKKTTQNSTITLASVVPHQTAIWQNYPKLNLINLEQIPLKGMYSTLGIDRALALYGAGKTWTFPILIIDAGTALTFTGADAEECLVGGAILPGVKLQLTSLGQKTGQLPLLETSKNTNLPPRFACNTQEAIYSGVIYTLLSGIKDYITTWLELYPQSRIVITGGDRLLLTHYLQIQYSEIANELIVEKNLIFWGINKIVYTS